MDLKKCKDILSYLILFNFQNNYAQPKNLKRFSPNSPVKRKKRPNSNF